MVAIAQNANTPAVRLAVLIIGVVLLFSWPHTRPGLTFANLLRASECKPRFVRRIRQRKTYYHRAGISVGATGHPPDIPSAFPEIPAEQDAEPVRDS